MSCAWSPTGTGFVSGGWDRTLRVWKEGDGKGGEILHTKRMQRCVPLSTQTNERFIDIRGWTGCSAASTRVTHDSSLVGLTTAMCVCGRPNRTTASGCSMGGNGTRSSTARPSRSGGNLTRRFRGSSGMSSIAFSLVNGRSDGARLWRQVANCAQGGQECGAAQADDARCAGGEGGPETEALTRGGEQAQGRAEKGRRCRAGVISSSFVLLVHSSSLVPSAGKLQTVRAETLSSRPKPKYSSALELPPRSFRPRGKKKMRVKTLEIRWHDSKPIYACDFQRKHRSSTATGTTAGGGSYKLATGGADKYVRVRVHSTVCDRRRG
jgi:hypothetical protein